ncbi:IS3 family transposase [Klebsiella pneumoniae]
MRAGAVCADILDYIEVFYNLERHHSHLSHFIPNDFEQVQL